MSENPINIKNFNWNPVVLKNLAKTSKNYHFLAPIVQKGDPYGPYLKQKTVFSEITKPDHKLSKRFYFNKISYVLA